MSRVSLSTLLGALLALCEITAANEIPTVIDGHTSKTVDTLRDHLKPSTVEFSGRPLHFVEVHSEADVSAKVPVVFVHGTPGGWDDYRVFMTNDSLQQVFRLIAVDRLGHGSSVGAIEPSLQVQAASLKAVLDQIGAGHEAKRAILVGHSLGGPIIARTAMDYPEQVAGLVFMASSADPRRSRKWYNLAGAIPPIRWLLSPPLSRANREILPLKRELTNMLPLWQHITVPTTVIQGGKDTLVDPRNAEFMREALTNAQVTMIFKPDANHFLHWQQPQVLINALSSFAQRNN